MGPTDKPYCRGANAIFRKLPDDKAECVIDFRDPSLLPSVLFHLNGEYHDSQMHIRETVELLREQLAAKDAEVKRLRGELGRISHHQKRPGDTFCGFAERLKRMAETALAATSRGEGQS